MSYKRLLQLAFAAVSAGSAAIAGPITYTMTATASGTLAGTPFANAAITVTSVADTSQVFVAGGVSPDLNYEVIPAQFHHQYCWIPDGNFYGPDVLAGSEWLRRHYLWRYRRRGRRLWRNPWVHGPPLRP